MKPEQIDLWDVLVTMCWLLLVVYVDVKYAWPCVVAIACICMRTRDLQAHECLLALYMLRHACGAMRSPSEWMSVPILALGVCARFNVYLELSALQRRFYTIVAVYICLALLHSTEDKHYVAVLRLVSYTVLTRYAVCGTTDTWDAIAQCVWILCCPAVALVLLVLQVNDTISMGPCDPLPSRRRAKPVIWTAHGVAPQEV